MINSLMLGVINPSLSAGYIPQTFNADIIKLLLNDQLTFYTKMIYLKNNLPHTAELVKMAQTVTLIPEHSQFSNIAYFIYLNNFI